MSNLNEEDIARYQEEEKTIEDYYKEWETLLETLSNKNRELYILKNKIIQKEQNIINTTDFNDLYGKNNEKIRKAHLNKELQADYDAKFDLEQTIEDKKRRIEYIKSLMNMQRTLIDVGVIE